MPPPHAPITAESSTASEKREATRTFRLVSADGGAALIEGLEPGAMTISARASKPQAAPVTRAAEATIVVRHNSLPMVTAPTKTAAPPSAPRRPIAAIVAGAAVVVVIGLFAARAVLTPASTGMPSTVVDAGTSLIPLTPVTVVAPVVAPPPDAVAAPAPDAGTLDIDTDAGVPVDGERKPTPVKPTKPTKPKKAVGPARLLPPLPPPPATLFDRTRIIATHCKDLPCGKDVTARVSYAPAAEIEKAAAACYAVCQHSPP
jgi:hypothetical protein